MKIIAGICLLGLSFSVCALTPDEFNDKLNAIQKYQKPWMPDSIAKYEALLKEDLTGQQKNTVLVKLVSFAATASVGDHSARLKQYMKEIDALPEAEKGGILTEIVTACRYGNMLFAKEIVDSNPWLFNDKSRISCYSSFLGIAKNQNRRLFDEMLKFILSFPVKDRIDATVQAANLINGPEGAAILNDAIKDNEVSPDGRITLLRGLISLAKQQDKTYAEMKKIFEEINVIINGTQNLNAQNAAGALVYFADQCAIPNSDYPVALRIYEKAYELNRNQLSALNYAKISLMSGDLKKTSELLDEVVKLATNNPKRDSKDRGNRNNAMLRWQASAAKSAISGNALADVIRDTNKAFEEYNFSTEEQLRMQESLSGFFFDARRYDLVRAVHTEKDKLFKPMVKKEFTVKYAPNIPNSADGWEHSELIRTDKYRETRFERESALYKHKETEAARLKDKATQPIPDGYETFCYIAYDEDGMHVFVQAKNPDAQKIRMALAKGGFLEMFLQPGPEKPYHWFWYSLPGTEDVHAVNWASPGKHYRLTYDYLTKNTTVAKDGVSAYTFIPWILCYDSLPVNGNYWKLGITRGDKAAKANVKVSFGGQVHELSRGLTLNFDFTEEQLRAIKHNIALRAFAIYRNERENGGGFLANYKDKELGDPEFYQRVLAPFLKELDEAGEKLVAIPYPSETNKEIDVFYEKYVPLWAEIKYVTADKRSEYLKNRFLN